MISWGRGQELTTVAPACDGPMVAAIIAITSKSSMPPASEEKALLLIPTVLGRLVLVELKKLFFPIPHWARQKEI